MNDCIENHDTCGLKGFVKAMHESKDTMHDWSHINRCFTSSRKIIRTNFVECDFPALVAGLILHGVIYEDGMEDRIRGFLRDKGIAPDKIEAMIKIAWDSQKESKPDTFEGGILHDAHLLEGDENFIITKVLVTGTARGQKLQQTVEYFFEHVLTAMPSCYFDSTREQYERRLYRAQDFFSSLRQSIA
jgi:uncharacterized protein